LRQTIRVPTHNLLNGFILLYIACTTAVTTVDWCESCQKLIELTMLTVLLLGNIHLSLFSVYEPDYQNHNSRTQICITMNSC